MILCKDPPSLRGGRAASVLQPLSTTQMQQTRTASGYKTLPRLQDCSQDTPWRLHKNIYAWEELSHETTVPLSNSEVEIESKSKWIIDLQQTSGTWFLSRVIQLLIFLTSSYSALRAGVAFFSTSCCAFVRISLQYVFRASSPFCTLICQRLAKLAGTWKMPQWIYQPHCLLVALAGVAQTGSGKTVAYLLPLIRCFHRPHWWRDSKTFLCRFINFICAWCGGTSWTNLLLATAMVPLALSFCPKLRVKVVPNQSSPSRMWMRIPTRSYPTIYLSILSIYQSIYLSINLSIYLSIYLSISLSIYLSISLSISLSI